jgi:hypothetical protein
MTFLIYALLGPPLGALVFWVLTYFPTGLMAMMRDFSWHAAAWSSSLKLLALYAGYSHLIGGLSAIGAGIGHAVMTKRLLSVKLRIVAVTVIGLILQAALMITSIKPSSLFEEFEGTISIVAAAGVASFLIALFVEMFRSRRKTAA